MVSERDEDESLPEGLEEPLKAVKRKTSRQGYIKKLTQPRSTLYLFLLALLQITSYGNCFNNFRKQIHCIELTFVFEVL